MTASLPIPCSIIMLAAGQGRRVGLDIPKQFLEIEGRAICCLSLDLFDGMENIIERVLVAPVNGLPYPVRQEVEKLCHPVKIVEGGHRRQDSVANGLAALESECPVALIHDTARPFPDPEAIAELVRRTADCGGGLLAARCADTVKLDDGAGCVDRTLDRSRLWLAQTPQAIRSDRIDAAIGRMREPEREFTDEASLLETMGVSVALVPSATSNFKITYPEDLERTRMILASRKNQ